MKTNSVLEREEIFSKITDSILPHLEGRAAQIAQSRDCKTTPKPPTKNWLERQIKVTQERITLLVGWSNKGEFSLAQAAFSKAMCTWLGM